MRNYLNLSVMKKIVICLLFSLGFLIAQAQIQNLEIIPEDPITPDDNVSVIAYTTHPYSGCPIVQTGITQFEDTIYIYVQHEMGDLTAICNAIDTTSLGNFVPGNYTVEYNFTTGPMEIPPFITDTARVEFTVQDINSVIGSATEALRMEVFPSPAEGIINIKTSYRGEAVIHDVSGKEMERMIISESPHMLNAGSLPAGLYFIYPMSPTTPWSATKFMVR